MAQIADLVKQGHEVVLVSSGAVAAGMTRLGWSERPQAIHELQAAAAVGQMGLIQVYEEAFQNYNLRTAQILLDHDDLYHRRRYLNARATMQELLRIGAVPIINENDTVSVDELKLGDNDNLAAAVATLVDADMLFIATDTHGLYSGHPTRDPDARPLPRRPTRVRIMGLRTRSTALVNRCQCLLSNRRPGSTEERRQGVQWEGNPLGRGLVPQPAVMRPAPAARSHPPGPPGSPASWSCARGPPR